MAWEFLLSKKFVRFVRFVVTGGVCGTKRAPHTEVTLAESFVRFVRPGAATAAPGGALYCDARCYKIGFVPLVHTNLMPLVDSNDQPATNRMWVARFDSKFPAGLKAPDPERRMYPRIKDLKERMREWAPYHFLLMVEGLREFRDRDEILPPGAQAVAGTLAHQALAEQTPEGKLRAWVEGHLEHVPAADKDRGSKLEELR
jgi:hypothetical protein